MISRRIEMVGILCGRRWGNWTVIAAALKWGWAPNGAPGSWNWWWREYYSSLPLVYSWSRWRIGMDMHREEVVGVFLWYEGERLFEVRRLKKYSRRVSAILASGPLHASTRFHPLPQTNFCSAQASPQGSTRRNLLRSTRSLIFG